MPVSNDAALSNADSSAEGVKSSDAEVPPAIYGLTSTDTVKAPAVQLDKRECYLWSHLIPPC